MSSYDITDPLSHVNFVHDYIQLGFQGSTFSIYNNVELITKLKVLTMGESGFCDCLVDLIGQSIQEIIFSPALSIIFSNGVKLNVSYPGEGPEAWELHHDNGMTLIESNA